MVAIDFNRQRVFIGSETTNQEAYIYLKNLWRWFARARCYRFPVSAWRVDNDLLLNPEGNWIVEWIK